MHGNEAHMLYTRVVLVSNCQTDTGTDFPGECATLENSTVYLVSVRCQKIKAAKPVSVTMAN